MRDYGHSNVLRIHGGSPQCGQYSCSPIQEHYLAEAGITISHGLNELNEFKSVQFVQSVAYSTGRGAFIDVHEEGSGAGELLSTQQ